MVEGSCHTPQQAEAGHWAPLGPALAALLISQSHNYRDRLFSEAPQTMESSLFPGRCVGGERSPALFLPSLPPSATGQQKEAARLLLLFGQKTHGFSAATSAPAWLR